MPGARWRIALGFQSDAGRARERNEDAYAVFLPYEGEERTTSVDGLFAVADGMGGHEAGDFASRFAADALLRAVTVEGDLDLEARYQWISRELRRIAVERGSSHGMGSTMTAAILRGDVLDVAHVGDTRLYRLRDRLEQLTPDHSWVAEQQRAGLLTPEEAAAHPRRNLLTQCLGIGPDLKVYRAEYTVQEGDRYLICCDGLHGQIPDPVIERVLRDETVPQKAVHRLVEMANETGGPDNITAVVFDLARTAVVSDTMPALAVTPAPMDTPVPELAAVEIPVETAAPRRRWSVPLIAAGLALVLGAAGWSAYAGFLADDGGSTGVAPDTSAVRADPAPGPSPADQSRPAELPADTAGARADSTGSAAAGGAPPQPNPDRQEPRS